jgi:hypothetical protein
MTLCNGDDGQQRCCFDTEPAKLLLQGVSAYPIYQVSYYPDTWATEQNCAGTPIEGWSWDLAEPCFTFTPSLGVTAGIDDSVSNPELTDDGNTLSYGYHPREDNCNAASQATKYASYMGCTKQLEGETYWLRITCVQAIANDTECTPLAGSSTRPVVTAGAAFVCALSFFAI